MRLLTLPLLLALYGCQADEPGEHAAPVGLDLALGTNVVVAGVPVDWGALLHFDDGTEIPVQPECVSDQQLWLHTTWDSAGEGTIVPNVAAMHLVTATATWQGKSYFDTAWLRVDHDVAATLDLALSAIQVGAGDPITYTLSAADQFGNVIDPAGITLAADSLNVVVADPRISSGVPGIYTVTASVDSLVDAETFSIVAGAPATLDLSLSTTELEIFQTTVATALVRDDYGNVLDVSPTLWVSGSGISEIAGPNITFPEEGWYTVTAEFEALSDSVGPFLIDSTGPGLDIIEPERGDWELNESALMYGTAIDSWSGIYSLTVNTVPVSVNGDGSFTHTLDYEFGLNLVQTEAFDGDGNPASDVRTVLDGAFQPDGSGIGNGIVGRVNEDGFDVIETMGEGLLADLDLSALVPNPVVSTSSESCIDLIFTEVCITWYSLDLYIWNPSIGATEMNIDPTFGGYLDTTFTVYDPYLEWDADGTVLGIGLGADGTIYADNISANMHLYPYVSEGTLGLSVGTTAISSSGFTFDWDSWLYDVMSFFGLDLSSLVEGLMVDALEDAIADEVPAAVADALGDLEIATSFDVGGAIVDLEAEPFLASVDDYGMSISLATYVSPQVWVHDETGLGSLFSNYTIPTYASASPGFQVSLSEDFLNQALFAFWGAGVLDQDLGGSDLGLDLGAFGDILGISDLHITTKALLPPVVVPGAGTSMLDLQIGDLELSLYDGEATDDNLRMRVYVTIFGGLDLEVSNGNLSPTLGDTEVFFDVTEPAANTGASRDTEDLLEALVPLLLPALTGAISEIPLPEIGGFSITIDGLRVDGPENGFITVDADLEL